MTAASYASADDYPSLFQQEKDETSASRLGSGAHLDTSRHRLTPGTRVGDHLVVRGVLGEGGTAVVYEALHTRVGASVALKVVDVADEYMEGARARLLREAHVCASLEDPHIPRIYDVGELPDGTPYVVMERVSGRTLENVLLQGALPLDIAVQVTEDLLVAVEAVERAGVVHRDIKPPNIILQTNSEGHLRVRLMDFGVSKNVSSEREPTQKVNTQANPGLTQQGAIVGTPHYMAPEQIVGPSVDSRADLYAVGVVAYEMMSGRTAFEGQTTGDVVAAVLHTRPLALSKLREVHPELEAWVERAMAPRRSDRFRSAREMREALREAWDEHLALVASSGKRSWARRARWVGAVGLVAVGVALPRPAGYETGALSRLLRGRDVEAASASSASSEDTLGQNSAEAIQAAAAAALPATAEAQAPLGASTSVVPSRDDPARPSEPSVAEPAPDAPAAAALDTSAPATGEPTPAARAGTRAPAELYREQLGSAPNAPAGQVTPAARKRWAQPALAAPLAKQPPARSLPPKGVLMNDYLRQLDKQLAAPAEPAPSAPRRSLDSRLPENPYGD
jgi:serine/threonine-protein kinase